MTDHSQNPPRRRISFHKPTDPFQLTPMRIIETPCYRCGFTTRHVLDHVEDMETKEWRERHDRLFGAMNEIARVCVQRHGTTPMYEDFLAAILKLRDEFGLKDPNQEGDEWRGK